MRFPKLGYVNFPELSSKATNGHLQISGHRISRFLKLERDHHFHPEFGLDVYAAAQTKSRITESTDDLQQAALQISRLPPAA